jgi:hypothetical protein
MAFNTEEAKSIKITAEVMLADAECDRQGVPRGTVQTVTWLEHGDEQDTEIEWSPGTERGWLRWAPQGQGLPTIP